MHSAKKNHSFHINAKYQGSGFADEYIIMYNTVHMNTSSLTQMQCNSAQLSLE